MFSQMFYGIRQSFKSSRHNYFQCLMLPIFQYHQYVPRQKISYCSPGSQYVVELFFPWLLVSWIPIGFFCLLANLINCLSMGINYKPRYHHDHQNLHPTMLYPPLSFFDVMRGLVGSASYIGIQGQFQVSTSYLGVHANALW